MSRAEDVDRARLVATAFRLLGTSADAEDAVQEAYTRWFRLEPAERDAIRNPDAWFTTVVGRICLDVLGSARVRREQYTGEWLPEPRPGHGGMDSLDPADRVSLDDQVTTALMVVLEALTPAERVAYVLHDLFAMRFDEIAEIVGRSPQACRKLASDARRDIRERRVREAAPDDHDQVARAFLAACATGRIDALVRLLDADVTLRSDGGGRVSSALRPVVGSDRVARFLLGLLAKAHREGRTVVPSLESVDGRTGIVLRSDTSTTSVVSLHVLDGVVHDVWMVTNPDKLTAW